MGAEYSLVQPCAVRAAFDDSQDDFARVLKQTSQLEALLESAKAKGTDLAELRKSPITRVKIVGGEAQEERIFVEAMEREAGELKALAPHCAGCSANIAKEPFGCCGYIAYPIPRAEEEWLLAQLPEDLEGTVAGQFLLRYLRDFRRLVRHVARQRGRGMLTEARSAPARRWGWPLFGKRVTADALLALTILGGNIEPGRAFLIGSVFGIVPHEMPADVFRGLKDDLHGHASHFRLPNVSQGQPGAHFARFLRTVWQAALTKQTVWIDA